MVVNEVGSYKQWLLKLLVVTKDSSYPRWQLPKMVVIKHVSYSEFKADRCNTKLISKMANYTIYRMIISIIFTRDIIYNFLNKIKKLTNIIKTSFS